MLIPILIAVTVAVVLITVILVLNNLKHCLGNLKPTILPNGFLLKKARL